MRPSSSTMSSSDLGSFSVGVLGKIAPICRTGLALQSRGADCIVRAIFAPVGLPKARNAPYMGQSAAL